MPGPISRLPSSSRQTRRFDRLPVSSIYSQTGFGFCFLAAGGAAVAGCGAAPAGAWAIIIAARNIKDIHTLPDSVGAGQSRIISTGQPLTAVQEARSLAGPTSALMTPRIAFT